MKALKIKITQPNYKQRYNYIYNITNKVKINKLKKYKNTYFQDTKERIKKRKKNRYRISDYSQL